MDVLHGMVRLKKLGWLYFESHQGNFSEPTKNKYMFYLDSGRCMTNKKKYVPHGGLNRSALKVYLNRIIVNMEICPEFRPG